MGGIVVDGPVTEQIMRIVSVLCAGGVAVLLFFTLVGIIEFSQYGPPPKGSLRLCNMKWEGSRITFPRAVFMLLLFPAGLVGVYLLVVNAGLLVPPVLLLLPIAFCAALVVVAYNYALMICGLIGYWIAALLMDYAQGYERETLLAPPAAGNSTPRLDLWRYVRR